MNKDDKIVTDEQKLEEFLHNLEEQYNELNRFKGVLNDVFDIGKDSLLEEFRIERLHIALDVFQKEDMTPPKTLEERIKTREEKLIKLKEEIRMKYDEALDENNEGDLIKLCKKSRMKTRYYDTLSSHRYEIYRFLSGEIDKIPRNNNWLVETYIVRRIIDKLSSKQKLMTYAALTKINSNDEQTKDDIQSFINNMKLDIKIAKASLYQKYPKTYHGFIDWAEKYSGVLGEQLSMDLEWLSEISSTHITEAAAQSFATDRLTLYKIGVDIEDIEERKKFQLNALEELKSFFLNLPLNEEEEIPPWMQF